MLRKIFNMIIDTKRHSVQDGVKTHSLQPKKSDNDRKERQKIYNCKKWTQLRLAKLYNDPICENCGRAM